MGDSHERVGSGECRGLPLGVLGTTVGGMDLKSVADYLLFRTWWTYRSGGPASFEMPFRAFNLFERVVWVVFSGLVLRRYLRNRHSTTEVLYAMAFFIFGLTDFREAYVLQSWLVWVKLANVMLLLWLRAHIIKSYYLESKVY